MAVVLDERKREILREIIQRYIFTAEPVGSETITGGGRLSVSAATVRNEMVQLEEMGFIRQPHTSAGRIPTDRGYRFYVDALLEHESLAAAERRRLRQRLHAELGEVERLVEETGRALAQATDYAAVAALPRMGRRLLRHVHLVPVGESEAMVVIVTNAGLIQGKRLRLPAGARPEELDRLSRAMSDRLRGRALSELSDRVLAEALHDATREQRLIDDLRTLVDEHALSERPNRVVIEGIAHLLRQPEFRDARRASPVLEALGQEAVATELLELVPADAVQIVIGRENRVLEMRECSIVAVAYRVGDRPVGALGVIGPTRMSYGKVIAIARFLADSLSERLTHLSQTG